MLVVHLQAWIVLKQVVVAYKCSSLFYAFPVGDLSVTAGPLVDQDDVVAATTSAYSDAFRLGSMPFSLGW